MGPKKGKEKGKPTKESLAAAKMAAAGPPKPKKIPPPPACFKPEELARYKELFRAHDETNIEKVPINDIPMMLRELGFNPKPAEVSELYKRFLEDELVDTVEYHEFLFMIEAKMNFGDDVEIDVVRAMQALGHDDEETGFVDFEKFKEELMSWGDPITEIEFMDWLRLAIKDKTYNPEDGKFNYGKFIENMNAKDHRFFEEPINFFKLDQKTLAEMAMKKAQEEKEEAARKEAEKKAREEARRQKLIDEGLLQPDA